MEDFGADPALLASLIEPLRVSPLTGDDPGERALAYYNENDPFAAAWLRELIKQGHIAPGVVDERDIRDVRPANLAGFAQCHFFAGIGVWSYALRRAGWPDDRPCWTASLPCQPWSDAGAGGGFDDERHLWPTFNALRLALRPVVCVGEQVASKAGLAWLDAVQADVEASGDAFGAIDLCSAGIGAPHIRQRLHWVAHSDIERLEGRCLLSERADQFAAWQNGVASGRPGPTNGIWRAADWLLCTDGKWRPVEPGTVPLAHGTPARVGRLRGYGNAINAEVATAFIEAVIGALGDPALSDAA